MLEKFKEWLLDFKRYYIRGYDIVIAFIVAVFLISGTYWLGYHSGWDDSYQQFDKARPHRPIIG